MARQKIENFNLIKASKERTEQYFRQKELIERLAYLENNFMDNNYAYPLFTAERIYDLPSRCLYYFKEDIVKKPTLDKIENYLNIEIERCEELERKLYAEVEE